MYKTNKVGSTSLKADPAYKGETIEEKVRRIVNNKEPIKDGAPLIYTERKDGVQPSYNIRTDRFEVAIEAHEAIYKANIARREERAKVINIETKEEIKKDTGGESIQGTDK
ncbi:MAG: hypothetical protein [Microviridae sp.]|nr:MAG: hypothetical protein [Microviridae sp.]